MHNVDFLKSIESSKDGAGTVDVVERLKRLHERLLDNAEYIKQFDNQNLAYHFMLMTADRLKTLIEDVGKELKKKDRVQYVPTPAPVPGPVPWPDIKQWPPFIPNSPWEKKYRPDTNPYYPLGEPYFLTNPGYTTCEAKAAPGISQNTDKSLVLEAIKINNQE